MLLGIPVAWVISQIVEMRAYPIRTFQQNVGDLQAGKRHDLRLFTLRNTDSLLKQIRGMPEIEEIYVDRTDITAAGMRHLGTLPNLKTIMAYQCVGDAGLLELRHCTKLEQVVIYDRSITRGAVAELKRHIPNVRVATSHDDEDPEEAPAVKRGIESDSPVENPAEQRE